MTDDEIRMLELAGARWRYAGSLEHVVRTELGMSLTRFWQRVSGLLDREDALAFDPVTVNRLRRLRDRGLTARRSRPYRHLTLHYGRDQAEESELAPSPARVRADRES